ncbi:2OG-Fe dioxygenase family protein [Streptomyces sp. 184]|uniref:2OG-Fe dioxygenase family protein n=1 Tax=Streptomyces sp. 184 TaxID=1827526 RepID=UPI0038925CDE
MKEPPTVLRDPAAPPAAAGHSADSLRRDGFARYRAADLGLDPAAYAGELAEIDEVYARLPPDPYAPSTNRSRRYSHAVYLPWTRRLTFVPGAPDAAYGTVTEYWQDDHNPEYPHMRRRLPDIPAAQQGNPLLLHLIHTDLAQAMWHEELQHAPLYVGVHMIKLAVHEPGERAVSSPDCLHQDGASAATFTFAHLIGCTNIRGGDNVIAAPEGAGRQPADLPPDDLYARFALTEPLDGYAVHDHRVSHYVAPVHLGDDPGPGERRILIIGLAPYAPRL